MARIKDAHKLRGLRRRIWAAIDGTLHPIPYRDCRGCIEASKRVLEVVRAERREGKRAAAFAGYSGKLSAQVDALQAKVRGLKFILERIKDEAYGQKQWAYVVDQATTALSEQGAEGGEKDSEAGPGVYEVEQITKGK